MRCICRQSLLIVSALEVPISVSSPFVPIIILPALLLIHELSGGWSRGSSYLPCKRDRISLKFYDDIGRFTRQVWYRYMYYIPPSDGRPVEAA